MTPSLPFSAVTASVHDVVIFGAGYSGFGAARTLLEAGKSVLLVDLCGAALQESGWNFQTEVGRGQSRQWGDWQGYVAAHEAGHNGINDGAATEVLANQWLADERAAGRLQVLYYAAPLAVEKDELLHAVLLGTKSGLLRIAARQWVDATPGGELQQLLVPGWSPPRAIEERTHIFLQQSRWDALPQLEAGLLPGCELALSETLWEEEKCLTLTAPGHSPSSFSLWMPALQAVRAAAPELLKDAVVSHGSVAPYRVYAAAGAPALPANVLAASPWLASGATAQLPAGRFDLGVRVAQQLADARLASPVADAPFQGAIEAGTQSCDIAVAGLGTGGAMAAIAAARQSAGQSSVLAFDPLPFPGGIGSGGGIHVYYFGVRGGLQEELDARVRAAMPLFGPRGQIRGFHPDAKKCVLEEMLREAGVQLHYGAALVNVSTAAGKVTSALLSTPGGPVRLEAKAWIDGTGDGDLCARAGVRSHLGRAQDGLPHAYSQSSGRLGQREEKVEMRVINYDAGFTDPTDAEDLTRARLVGIGHYLQPRFTYLERPTYIAPAIGLRQSRHMETDYTLQLEDQVFARRFSDSIGLSGCHYDNHASDYEMESLEGIFLVWVCQAWRQRMAHEIPYRVLLPVGLDNVWLACRALGVSQDAHHSLRMQRDMQRIGEVAGLAAAIAPQGQSRQVDLEQLQTLLRQSGALTEEATDSSDFGIATANDALLQPQEEDLEKWFQALELPEGGLEYFKLYRAGVDRPAVAKRVEALLTSANPLVAWRAAAITAMWGNPAAEAVLLDSIRQRHSAEDASVSTERTAPRWLVSLSLLRKVITPAALPVLAEVAAEPEAPHALLTSLALCLEALVSRCTLSSPQRQSVVELLDNLSARQAANAVAPIQRAPLETQFEGQWPDATATRIVREDWSWQVHLGVARARRALGLEPHEAGLALLQDDRSLVRKALQAATQ